MRAVERCFDERNFEIVLVNKSLHPCIEQYKLELPLRPEVVGSADAGRGLLSTLFVFARCKKREKSASAADFTFSTFYT